MRFVVLDEVPAQPELVSSLGKRLRTQTEFRLDDRAGNIAAILDRATQDPPQVGDVLGRAVKKLNGTLGHVEIVDFGVFDVAHALVVADHQRQERYDHHPPIGDVTVEKVQRVGDAHLFAGLVDQVDQGIYAAGKLVGGAHFDIGTGGRLGGEVGCRLQIIVARFRLHLVSHENVPATLDQVFFPEAEVGVTI